MGWKSGLTLSALVGGPEMVKEQVIEEEAEAVQFIGANYVAHYAFGALCG